MQIKVLGAAGGIDAGVRTMGFLLDGDTLIDAGTGVWDLPLAVQQGINQVFLTHAHFDHLVGLPFLADSVSRYRADRALAPVRVYARAPVLEDLRRCIFNNHLWSDMTRLPSLLHPTLEFLPVEVGNKIALPGGRLVEAISAVHTVPSVGFAVHHHGDTWLFTGDTGRNPLLWQYINQLPNQGQHLRWLVTECTFANDDQAFADLTGHYTAHSLSQDINEHLRRGDFEIYLGHLKPSDKEAIQHGLDGLRKVAQEKKCQIHLLQKGQVFDSLESRNISQVAVMQARP